MWMPSLAHHECPFASQRVGEISTYPETQRKGSKP